MQRVLSVTDYPDLQLDFNEFAVPVRSNPQASLRFQVLRARLGDSQEFLRVREARI